MKFQNFAARGALVVGTTFLAASCHDNPEATREVVPIEKPSLDEVPLPLPNELVREMAQTGQVAVSVLVAPVEGGQTFGPLADLIDETIADAESGHLASQFEQAFSVATYGRLATNVNVEVLPPQTVPGECLDAESPDQVNRFAEIADHNGTGVDGEMDFIIAGLPGCPAQGDYIGTGGYSVNNSPLASVVVLAIDNNNAVNRAHEFGHQLGLPHAASMYCDQPLDLEYCAPKEPTGGTSVMGYNTVEVMYSAPEMMVAGLLDDAEIQAIDGFGEYGLAAMLRSSPDTAPKVLTYTTPNGRQLLISYERKLETESEENCYYYGDADYNELEVHCRLLPSSNNNFTTRVRIRRDDSTHIITDVQPEPAVLDGEPFNFIYDRLGYAENDEVIYRDEDVTMTIQPMGGWLTVNVTETDSVTC